MLGERGSQVVFRPGLTVVSNEVGAGAIDGQQRYAATRLGLFEDVASIVAGSKMHEEKLNGIFASIKSWDGAEADAYDPKVNSGLQAAVRFFGFQVISPTPHAENGGTFSMRRRRN